MHQARQSQAAKPIVLADVQDNRGAGGTLDTTGILAELIRQGAEDAVVGVLVDPQAAQAAHAAGIGGTVDMAVGGKLFTAAAPPVRAPGLWSACRMTDFSAPGHSTRVCGPISDLWRI